MVGDITYVPTWEGWLYLATVIDCHTKAVIGWAMDDSYKTPLISAAIDMAVRNHSISPPQPEVRRAMAPQPRHRPHCCECDCPLVAPSVVAVRRL